MNWHTVRKESDTFLAPWEPVRGYDYMSRSSFKTRVYWNKRSVRENRSVPLLLFRKDDEKIVGGLTLDNIQKGVAQCCTVGYWVGEKYARKGYMSEALSNAVQYAFTTLDISRVQAGCLPENKPSRALLEKNGFKYEGVAQSYLQIAGRWRNHVLYANLRRDRRGRTDINEQDM